MSGEPPHTGDASARATSLDAAYARPPKTIDRGARHRRAATRMTYLAAAFLAFWALSFFIGASRFVPQPGWSWEVSVFGGSVDMTRQWWTAPTIQHMRLRGILAKLGGYQTRIRWSGAHRSAFIPRVIPMPGTPVGRLHLSFPLWIPAGFGFAGAFYHRRKAARYRLGHCRHCAYDLQGNTSGVCPECGAAVPASS